MTSDEDDFEREIMEEVERVSQPKGIGDHGDGTEAHRGRCDHRVEEQPEREVQHPGRNRHPEQIVHEREGEVLANVLHRRPAQHAGLRDAPQVTLHERIPNIVK